MTYNIFTSDNRPEVVLFAYNEATCEACRREFENIRAALAWCNHYRISVPVRNIRVNEAAYRLSKQGDLRHLVPEWAVADYIEAEAERYAERADWYDYAEPDYYKINLER